MSENGVIEYDSFSGFSPVIGMGYEQRLGDWLLTLEFNTSFEADARVNSALSIGTGYRF